MRLHNLIIPILLAVCIGLRLECVTIDVLHVVDLGIYSHISANIIWHFFVRKRVMGGSTQHLSFLNNVPGDLRVPLGFLKGSSLKDPQGPSGALYSKGPSLKDIQGAPGTLRGSLGFLKGPSLKDPQGPSRILRAPLGFPKGFS